MCFLRDFLTAEDKEGVFNADHFPLWYKRAAEQVPGTFVYSIPFSTGMQNKTWDSSSKEKLHQTWVYLPFAAKLSGSCIKHVSIYLSFSSTALCETLFGNSSGSLTHSAFYHLNQSFSMSISLCYGLWFLLVSTDRMCSTAHLPPGWLQLMWPTFCLLARGRMEGWRIQLHSHDIYHLSSVNDDCIHSDFAIITWNVPSQHPFQNY